MALIPKIDICINNKCDKVDIYEETGPYNASTNAGGWGAPNIDTAAITTAQLDIQDYAGNSTLDTYIMYDGTTDVYSGVAGAPTPGSFLAIKDASWGLADGVYKLVYTVNTTLVNASQHELVTCSINNCMDKLRGYIVTECDAKKLAQQKETYEQLELLLLGIQSAFSCGDFEEATSLIAKATTICDNLCDCGCNDC